MNSSQTNSKQKILTDKLGLVLSDDEIIELSKKLSRLATLINKHQIRIKTNLERDLCQPWDESREGVVKQTARGRK